MAALYEQVINKGLRSRYWWLLYSSKMQKLFFLFHSLKMERDRMVPVAGENGGGEKWKASTVPRRRSNSKQHNLSGHEQGGAQHLDCSEILSPCSAVGRPLALICDGLVIRSWKSCSIAEQLFPYLCKRGPLCSLYLNHRIIMRTKQDDGSRSVLDMVECCTFWAILLFVVITDLY